MGLFVEGETGSLDVLVAGRLWERRHKPKALMDSFSCACSHLRYNCGIIGGYSIMVGNGGWVVSHYSVGRIN